MSQDFFRLHDMKFLRMYENFDFPTVAKNIYRSVTAIEPLTGRNTTVTTLLLLIVPYCYITP